MEREHSEIHPIVKEANRTFSFRNILLVFSLLGIGSQAVLLSKVILVDRDIATAGFSLFFYALFGIVYLLSLQKAGRPLIKWSGLIVAVLSGAVSFIVLSCLDTDILVWLAGLLISLTLCGTTTIPSFLMPTGARHDK